MFLLAMTAVVLNSLPLARRPLDVTTPQPDLFSFCVPYYCTTQTNKRRSSRRVAFVAFIPRARPRFPCRRPVESSCRCGSRRRSLGPSTGPLPACLKAKHRTKERNNLAGARVGQQSVHVPRRDLTPCSGRGAPSVRPKREPERNACKHVFCAPPRTEARMLFHVPKRQHAHVNRGLSTSRSDPCSASPASRPTSTSATRSSLMMG